MSSNRPILPRLVQSDDLIITGNTFGGSSRAGRRKIERISHACELCRRKKVKCDGLRPVCSPCSLRKASCEYISPTGQSKLDIANSRLEAYATLFATLKDSSPQQRDSLIQQIQSADDVLSLAQLNISDPGVDFSDERSPRSNWDHGESSLASSEQAVVDSETASINQQQHQQQQPPPPQHLGQGSTVELLWKFEVPGPAITRAALDVFYESSSQLFHVFSQEAIKMHFEGMFDQSESSQSTNRKIATACVCSAAAVGCQYSNGDFDETTEKAFYDVARHCLETVVAHAPLDAIAVCSLLTMYNVMGKGTIALTYVEMGLSMARMQGLYDKRRPHEAISQTKWVESRKVWRALIFFSSWLGATLGYVSGNDALFGIRVSDMDVADSQDPEDVVQAEMTKISILKASVVRLLVTFKDISELTADSILGDLAQWHSQLPPQMQLANIDSKDTSVGLRRTIYYTHLLHLGAIMLVYRLTAYKAQRLSALSPAGDDAVGMRFQRFATHGISAARQSARIVDVLMTDNGVFRRCWLVMFQSYTSCLALLHAVVQEQLHGFPRSAWEQDLRLASCCIKTLEHCGQMDTVASKFHRAITRYYDRVVQSQSTSAMEDAPFGGTAFGSHSQAMPSSDNLGAYMLHIPAHADPQRARLAQELLRMVCVPFGDGEAKSLAEELARQPGWHPDPTCYEHPQLIEQLDCDLEKEVRLYNTGAETLVERFRSAEGRPDASRFVGNSEPHGWSLRGYPATHDISNHNGA